MPRLEISRHFLFSGTTDVHTSEQVRKTLLTFPQRLTSLVLNGGLIPPLNTREHIQSHPLSQYQGPLSSPSGPCPKFKQLTKKPRGNPPGFFVVGGIENLL